MTPTAKVTFGWLCVLAWCCLAGCGKHGESGRPEASAEFEPNKQLFSAIAKTDRLDLYEGLPHQMWQPELLEQERRDKPMVEFHGFPFYRPPLDVPAEDAAQLKIVLGTEGSFRQWRGEKKCGGFHPDYLAEWRTGEAVYRVLICFGCGEVMVFGPDHTLRCDIEQEVQKKLRELLKKYRKNRPASQEP